jgi:hypothetical protein
MQSSMDDNTKIVIRGVLDKMEDENINDKPASLINKALQSICGGNWNIVTYTAYESKIGFTASYFHWRSKQWVYAEQTTCTTYNSNEIETLMNIEFGWASIKDINMVQESAHHKINNKFPGTWRVHVARLNGEISSSLFGIVWESDGFTFFIYRIA